MKKYNSPLMRRLQESSKPQKRSAHPPIHYSPKRENVPQGKGVIRMLLISLCVLFVIIIVWNNNKSAQNDTQIGTDSLSTSASELPKKVVKEKLPSLFSLRLREMSFADVTQSISQKPPCMTMGQDTVMWRKNRIIRHFSLDTTLQKQGKTYMNRYRPKYGAAVVLQPQTGRVLSMVSYTNPEVPSLGKNLFLSGEFPAASIFKTVTAAAVIEKNELTLSSLLPITGRNHTLYRQQLEKTLKNPRKVSLLDAYAYSFNPIFGRLAIYNTGENALSGSAQKFGFNATVPFEFPVEKSHFEGAKDSFHLAELASGFNKETTLSPVLGALIAGALSHGGKMYRPTFVDSVTDMKTEETVYRAAPQLWRIITTPAAANDLKSMMEAVTKYGTARKSFKTIKESARFDTLSHGGKTGSVDKEGAGRVDWFVGFVGDSTNTDLHLSSSVFTVHGAQWTVHSAYIASEMMRRTIMREQIEAKKRLETPEPPLIKNDSTEQQKK